MKRTIFILPVFLLLFACTKDEPARTSGTDTIDNIIYYSTQYFSYGFSFSEGKQVSQILIPTSDITLVVNKDNATPRLTFQSNNFKPSFFKVGDYPDEASAKAAFDNLKTVSVTVWTDMADPVNTNQVWIYRSGTDTYTKIRIVSTVNEKREGIDYGECTFQWVYQPDGSLTFP